MKKLIIILMTLLLMAGMVSAGFESYYKDSVSPYKTKWLNATYRMELAAGNNAVVNFNNACDVLDVTEPFDADGMVPCVNIMSPALSITLKNMAMEEKTTKEAYAVRADTMGLSFAVFDVFYKTRVSPDAHYEMKFLENATRIAVDAAGEYNAIFSFSESCDVSDDRSYTFDADGRVPCMEIMTPNEGITITTDSGETLTTKDAFVYIHAPCTDSDGQNAYSLGETWGIEEYTTGGYPPTAISPYQQFNDMCSAALRGGAVPTEGTPYIAVEAYCRDDRVKYTNIECAAEEMCEGGICVPLPATTRSGSCRDVECAEGEICRAGVCVSRGAAATEDRKERVKLQLKKTLATLAKTEASKCGTALKAPSEISGEMDVTKLTAALKEITATQARIAKCAGVSGFETAPAVRASTKADASKLLATFHNNAKTMMKTKTMSDVRAKTEATKTPADATKTPTVEATKTPVTAEKTVATKTPIAEVTKTPSFFSRLFGTKTPA